MATHTPVSQTRPGLPEVHPWHWIGAFICAALIYFIVLSTAGSFING